MNSEQTYEDDFNLFLDPVFSAQELLRNEDNEDDRGHYDHCQLQSIACVDACLALVKLPELAIGDFLHVETCQGNSDRQREQNDCAYC